ncbi:23S rRNA pseudouridine(2604) synthase RluF [Algoriphagus sediminis]|uniref:Pseudouridine synthase n=1 Tax=Algoriphagus sediminis TaxID=3057113 RepID=A0ABT7YE73_9BACT|nr:23S rRNA pseudouridine(2604) synthase RluF [Algoriphagus sediminis]MDN3204819.1 23S rRNA pseudouridine(2604) synthase RluF [Algoriphagus sediminis]
MSESDSIRINKYLSEVGYCSRREGDKLLEQGRIRINGKKPELGTKVKPGDTVTVDGKPIGKPTQDHTYIAFNKPVGIVCTTDTRVEKDNIIDFIKHPKRIFPIGRLDKESEGLIFLTSDGDIVNKILRAKNNHEKEYIVTVDKPINAQFLKGMAKGVPILDTITQPCTISKLSKFKFRIILTQGLNRQIRRMCEYFGYSVKQLKRVRIMNVMLDIPVGKWRDLTPDELAKINELTSDSSKTFDG